MINRSLFRTKPLSYTIIWVILVNASFVFSVDANHIKCLTPFTCGDQNNLLYPFWNDGREECGHPDFKLNCSESSAELTISSVKFRILSASYDSGKITLVRSDYIGNLCPSDPVNAQFNETILPLAPDTELLTFYYGCNGLSLDISGFSYVGELGCGDDDNSYYVTRNLSSLLLGPFRTYLDSFREFCPRRVTIPASKETLTKLEESRSRDDLQGALDQGFELGVNQNCSRCMNSSGACGYNLSISDFVCYCIDGSHNRICGSQDKGKISCVHVVVS